MVNVRTFLNDIPDYWMKLTRSSCCVTDGRNAEALDDAGGHSVMCAGMSGSTGRCLPPKTRKPRRRRASWRTGKVLHRPETLHQPDHQTEVSLRAMGWSSLTHNFLPSSMFCKTFDIYTRTYLLNAKHLI